MEYRTTHLKVLSKLERKKHEKERKKTKGKFIVSIIRTYMYVHIIARYRVDGSLGPTLIFRRGSEAKLTGTIDARVYMLLLRPS